MRAKLLEEVIRSSGLKKGYIADYIGITPQSFILKSTGRREFRQSELAKLKSVLALTDDQMNAIFFDVEVDKEATATGAVG